MNCESCGKTLSYNFSCWLKFIIITAVIEIISFLFCSLTVGSWLLRFTRFFLHIFPCFFINLNPTMVSVGSGRDSVFPIIISAQDVTGDWAVHWKTTTGPSHLTINFYIDDYLITEDHVPVLFTFLFTFLFWPDLNLF